MKIHMVKKGDSLYKIAQKYNVDLDKVIEANPHIANPDQINVGEKVKIPGMPTKPHHHEGQHHDGQHHDGQHHEGHHHEGQHHDGYHHEGQHHDGHHHGGQHHEPHHLVKHIVQQGDTLWKLSKAWGIPLKEMIEVNTQLKNPSVLMTGETVYIPKKGHKEQEGVQGYQPHHGGTAHGKKNTAPIQPVVPVPEVVEHKPEVVQPPPSPEINQITKITEINLNLAKVTDHKEEVKIELPAQPAPKVELPVIEQPPVQPVPQPPVPEYQLPQLVLPQIELPSYTPQPPPQHPCEPVVPTPYPAYVKEAEAIPDCGGYPEIFPMIQPCPPYAPFVSPYGHHHEMWKKEPCGCDGGLPVPYGHHGAYEGGWGHPQTLPYPSVEIPQGIPSYQAMAAPEEEFIQPAGHIQAQPYPSQPWFPSQPGLYGGMGVGPDLNTPYTDGTYCAEKPAFGQHPGYPEPYMPFGHEGFEHGGYGNVGGWPQSHEQAGGWPQGLMPQQWAEQGQHAPGGYGDVGGWPQSHEQAGGWPQGLAPQQRSEQGQYARGGHEQESVWTQGYASPQEAEQAAYALGSREQAGVWSQGYASPQEAEQAAYALGGQEQAGVWPQGYASPQEAEQAAYASGGREQAGVWPQGYASPQEVEQAAYASGGHEQAGGWPQGYASPQEVEQAAYASGIREQAGGWPQGYASPQEAEQAAYASVSREQAGGWPQDFAPQQQPVQGQYAPGGYGEGGGWPQGFALQQQPVQGQYAPGGYGEGGGWPQGFAPQQQPVQGQYAPGGYGEGGGWPQGFAPQQQPVQGQYAPGGYGEGGGWPQGFAPQPYGSQAFAAGLASIPPSAGKKDCGCGCGGAKKGRGQTPETTNFPAYPSGFDPYTGGAQQSTYTPFTSYGQPDWERIYPPAFPVPYGYGPDQEGAVNPYAQIPQPAYAVSGPQFQGASNGIEGFQGSEQGYGDSEARIHLADQEEESDSFLKTQTKAKKTSAPKKSKASKSSVRTIIRKSGRSAPKQTVSANVPWMNV
ncbi:LysM peptidoglycan-binding domain-containing protein [Paenibacillus chitinolyticus]|uniref:LysM peptidoglycan-binding domain-containing protein n=1 Tax=Paenibacillus chitinolyticus TaxID=79263 RepID=UPI00355897A8